MAVPAYFSFPENLTAPENRLVFGIGALVCEWGNVESVLFGIFDCLVGRADTDHSTALWVATKGSRARREILVHLSKCQDISPVTPEEVADLVKRFKGITDVRNFFCHAHYVSSADGTIKSAVGLTLTPESDPIRETERPVNKALLNELAHTIRLTQELNSDAWGLLIRLKEATKAQHVELPEGLDEYLRTTDSQPRPSGRQALPPLPRSSGV